jgi:hypothetical protein
VVGDGVAFRRWRGCTGATSGGVGRFARVGAIRRAISVRGHGAVIGCADCLKLSALGWDDGYCCCAFPVESGGQQVADGGHIVGCNAERLCGEADLLDEVSDLVRAEIHVSRGRGRGSMSDAFRRIVRRTDL